MDIITYGLLKKKIRELTEELNELEETVDELAKEVEDLGKYQGKTVTPIQNGDITNPIEMEDGEWLTVKTGDWVIYGNKEFIWDGDAWDEAGDLSALGDLAYVDSASAAYTPHGSVSQATFNGTTASLTNTFTPNGHLTDTALTIDQTTMNSITNVGTLPSHSYSSGTLTLDPGTLPTKGSDTTVVTDIASITQPTFVGDDTSINIDYIPEGTITSQTFTGTEETITVTPST